MCISPSSDIYCPTEDVVAFIEHIATTTLYRGRCPGMEPLDYPYIKKRCEQYLLYKQKCSDAEQIIDRSMLNYRMECVIDYIRSHVEYNSIVAVAAKKRTKRKKIYT